VLMWTYTLPSERTIEMLNETGYPLFTGALGCARTLRALADYRAMRERSSRPIDRTAPQTSSRAKVAAAIAQSPSVLCEYRARSLLAAYGIGAENAGRLARSIDEAVAAAHAIGWPVALKVQSADIAHKTEAGAIALDLVGDNMVRAAYNKVLGAAKRNAPTALIDGVLVQPMAPSGREVLLGINRDPTWGLLLIVGLGGVLVEALGDVALAPVPLDKTAAHAIIGRLTGARAFAPFSRRAGGGHRSTRRPYSPTIAFCHGSCRRHRRNRSQPSHRPRAGRRRLCGGCADRAA
jgi:acetate---CoA ligase (ADP-forming)